VLGLVAVAGVLILALVVAVVALALRPSTGAAAQPAPAVPATPTANRTPTVADIYRRVGPAVVVVRTDDGSLGSGVIAADDGSVLTANHVIADGGAISVIFADGTTFAAMVAASDPKTDIATLTPATLPQPVVLRRDGRPARPADRRHRQAAGGTEDADEVAGHRHRPGHP